MKVESGRKEKVWLPSGEEILAKSGIIHWEEDLAHLRNQLTVEQPGPHGSIDMAQQKKDLRRIQEVKRIKARMTKEEIKKNECFKTVTLEDSEDEAHESDTDNDDNYVDCSKSKRQKIVNVMGSISAAADRANVSCKTMALMGAAAAKELGVNIHSTNCSVTTAWR